MTATPKNTGLFGDRVQLAISDETFIEGMAGLRWRLRALVLSGARVVVVDIDRVRDLSSAAVAALISTHRVCRARGGGVVLRNPSRRTLDMLRRTGLNRVFSVDHDGTVR